MGRGDLGPSASGGNCAELHAAFSISIDWIENDKPERPLMK
jgi:hypothetical protein